MSINQEKITVGDALELGLEDDNFLYLRHIFARVCELCVRGTNNDVTLKKNFEERLKKEFVKGRAGSIVDIIRDIKHESRQDERRAQMIYFYAMYTLDNAFDYCCSVSARETNSLDKLSCDESESASLERDYLITILTSMSVLEDITANYLTSETTRLYVEKAIEKTVEQERASRKKGGFVRAENERKKKEPIKEEAIRIYKNPNAANRTKWTSRNEFARYFSLNHNKNIANEKEWIKESAVKTWIREYLENG